VTAVAPTDAGRTTPTIRYALLGLLAIRSWTGYELTQQVRRSLRLLWPSSEAHLYREQQRLARLGWATVTTERVGQRSRNRYTITEAGRTALSEYLATPPAAPALEGEALVRLFFADQGEVGDLVDALERTAQHTREALAGMVAITEQYLAGEGLFPERAHLSALAGEIIADILGVIDARCAEAAREVAQWDTTRGRGLDDATRARFERMVATYGHLRPPTPEPEPL
jgi:PadR family transcriptional regulator, regulatory protein AphA